MPQAGEYALWGQDLTPLYGKTLTFSGDGATTYQVTLPAQGTITSAARCQHHHPVLPELP